MLMLAIFDSRKIAMNCKGAYPQTSLIWARAWSIVGGKTLPTETSHHKRGKPLMSIFNATRGIYSSSIQEMVADA
jgi:hypothetical protein